MAAEYHVRIKEEYAVQVIEDLEKRGAIELLNPAEGVDEQIPDRQQEESLRRLAAYRASPSIAVPWDVDEAELKEDENDGGQV